jgi:hypothetical protein
MGAWLSSIGTAQCRILGPNRREIARPPSRFLMGRCESKGPLQAQGRLSIIPTEALPASVLLAHVRPARQLAGNCATYRHGDINTGSSSSPITTSLRVYDVSYPLVGLGLDAGGNVTGRLQSNTAGLLGQVSDH